MVKIPHWPLPHERSNIDLGLSKIKTLLEALGNPHLKIPPVIHIAGTNGKGSTSAFCKAIFEAAGYKTHSYTSPHLVNYNERIKILGTDISDDFLFEVIEECRIASEKIGINTTFFEGTTAAAFLAFSKVPADIVILETGLGGRLDATNVIESPLLTIITSISLDHVDFLGNTLTQIANEKAGIFKKNTKSIISYQYDEVFAALELKAKEVGSELISFEYEWGIEKTDIGFKYKSASHNMDLPNPKLIGDHQYINAGNAITAALNSSNFTITRDDIIKGLLNVKWPGRLQQLTNGTLTDMLPPGSEIWVDGAHNVGGANVLSHWVKQNQDLPTYLIFGTTKGRDVCAFLEYFKDITQHLMAVPIDAEPLSYSAEDIAKASNSLTIPTSICLDTEEAILKIVKMETRNFRILICGSLYLAGNVLYINQKLLS